MATSQGGSSEHIHQTAAQILLRSLDKKAPLLDLGAGRGEFAELLAGLDFNSIDACDGYFSPEETNQKIRFTRTDLNKDLPYGDSTFMGVTALEVIEHLENPRAFVREIARILKPGGLVLISTPNLESFTSLASLAFRGYPSAFAPACYPAHISPLLEIDLRRILKENSFINARTIFSGQGRMPAMDLEWRKLLGPLARGKRFSDNYFITAKKA